jgi:hypothetical protein
MGTAQVAFAGDRTIAQIGLLRMTESDASHMTGSDVSHVTGSDVSHCPEVCSAHAQPEVAPYPP